MTTDLAHTFNWQTEPEDSFLKWVGVHIGGPTYWAGEAFEQLAAASDQFQAVKITIQVNGLDVDASRFFKELEAAVDYNIEAGVRDRIKESSVLTGIDDLADRLTTAFKAHVYKAAHEAGIEFPDEDEWG